MSKADHRFKNEGGRKGRVRLRTDGRGGGCLFLLLFAFSLVVFPTFFLAGANSALPIYCLDDGEPPGRVKKESKRRKEEGEKEHFASMLPLYPIHSTVLYFFFKRGLDLEEYLFL